MRFECYQFSSYNSPFTQKQRIYGPSCVKICGRTYHSLPSVAGTNSGTSLSFLIFDARELQASTSTQDSFDPRILSILRTELAEYNQYVMELADIGSCAREAETDNDIQELIPYLNSKTSIFEIGAIVSDRTSGEISIQFKARDGFKHRLNGLNSPLTEPLVYPLFFCHGEQGWSPRIKQEVPVMKYLASRILMPELKPDYAYTSEDRQMFKTTGRRPIMMRPNAAGQRLQPCSRFTLFSRLKQYYLVEMMSQIIENRLNWISRNQGKFIPKQNTQDHDSDQEHDDHGNDELHGDTQQTKTFLSDSFTGSARYFQHSVIQK